MGVCADIVRAARYQTPQFHDALAEITRTVNDPKAPSEAQSLCSGLKNFEFTVVAVFWYAIIFQVNQISNQVTSSTDC